MIYDPTAGMFKLGKGMNTCSNSREICLETY